MLLASTRLVLVLLGHDGVLVIETIKISAALPPYLVKGLNCNHLWLNR